MYTELAILTIFVFLYSLVAGGIDRTIISGPIIFVVTGFILGPLCLGWFDGNVSAVGLRVFADLTLALILFIDAANADLSTLKKQIQLPSRMLLLGLPGVIILGTLFAAVFFNALTFLECAILGTILAATDAALGKAVITNKAVPAKVREGLNFESGLNDGLCVPILFVFLALATGDSGEHGSTVLAVKLVVKELGIGLLVGLVLTGLGLGFFRICWRQGWVTEVWMQVTVVALAIASFSIAQTMHGSGYIAAFSGGLLFGAIAKKETHKLVLAAEGTGETMALMTWLIFGSAVIGQAASAFTWNMILYAILSLTVIRMLPIFLCLHGAGESNHSRLFLGWFGPRGLASIVFSIIVINNNLPGASTIAMVVVCTVASSLMLHGVTANPLAKRFGAIENNKPD